MELIKFVFFIALLSLSGLSAKEKVLLIDGHNPSHKWAETSKAIKGILSAQFEVEQLTHKPEQWQRAKVDFTQYKAVVLNYWGTWPKELFQRLDDYLANGGGLVTVHSALASFPNQPKFAEMVGLKWQGKNLGRRLYLNGNCQPITVKAGEGIKCGHSHQHEFAISACPDSFLKKTIEQNPKHYKDEMYHGLRGPIKNLSVDGYSLSPNTKKNEPLIWNVKYGQGRSFVTALGHSTIAMKSPVFRATLLEGALWAARQEKASIQLSKKKQAQPDRETINKHIDESVPVFGKYALVKLPIKSGVTLWNPTCLARDDDGRIWAANYTGEIYSLHDTDGDGLEDHAEQFSDVKDRKLRYPTCMVWQKGELYVGTTQEIVAYKDTDGDFKADSVRVFFDDFPWTLHYFDWTFGLEFGPDDHAYVIFCTDDLNAKRAEDRKKYRGSVVRISPDGKSSEIFATGARFAYGMAFNQHGDLFFSDNKSGGNPTEELNWVQKGKFYGHNGAKFSNKTKTEPLVKIKHGFGPGGLEFNPLSNDFDGTAGNLFLACWGPDGRFNRGSLVRISLTKKADGTYDAKEHLVAGEFAKIIDAKFSSTGDLYIAQFGLEGRAHTPAKYPDGSLYRMIHAPWKKVPLYKDVLKSPIISGNYAEGKKVFDARCLMCHDNASLSTEKLGPPLKGIGNMFDQYEILTAIKDPSRGIKTDYETHEVRKKDGTLLQGRVVSIDEVGVNLMLPGNLVLSIPKDDVKSQKMLNKSLMPEGLLNGLSDKEVRDLLAYMKIRQSNLALAGKASSPDNLKRDGISAGDQAGIDGNKSTYWDEVDHQKEYVYQVDFKEKKRVRKFVLTGYKQHSYSPKDFEVLADGKVIHSVKNAQYKDNIFEFTVPETHCKTIQLKITKAWGGSPAIRELEIYD